MDNKQIINVDHPEEKRPEIAVEAEETEELEYVLRVRSQLKAGARGIQPCL